MAAPFLYVNGDVAFSEDRCNTCRIFRGNNYIKMPFYIIVGLFFTPCIIVVVCWEIEGVKKGRLF